MYRYQAWTNNDIISMEQLFKTNNRETIRKGGWETERIAVIRSVRSFLLIFLFPYYLVSDQRLICSTLFAEMSIPIPVLLTKKDNKNDLVNRVIEKLRVIINQNNCEYNSSELSRYVHSFLTLKTLFLCPAGSISYPLLSIVMFSN